MSTGQAFEIRLLGGDWGVHMTCQEANCKAYAEGWVSVLDTSDSKMAGAANWIKQSSRRKFYEWGGAHALDEAMREQANGNLTVTPDLRAMLAGLGDGMVVFFFTPGQQCFRYHEDREVKFHHISRRGVYEHSRGIDFNEHQNEEADRMHVLRARG